MSSSTNVEDLRNIGSTIASRLNEIGVFTERDLRALGAVEAHRLILRNFPDKTLPICYYLYSFEAALRDVHWDDLPESKKRTLRNQLGEQGVGERRR
ncbi:MAG: DNA transformation protein [Verrucomicrobiales bacterium]|jgi:DNA transformation protein